MKVICKNAHKLNKHNWQNVVAQAKYPCTNVHGVKAIDAIKAEAGFYYEKWRIKKEPKGYIFREINHNGGICGHHKTFRKCLYAAMFVDFGSKSRIDFFIPQA